MNIKPIEDANSEFNTVYLTSTHKDVQDTPHCQKHGAMNKVSVFKEGGGYWRCCTTEATICRSGCIETKEATL